MSPEILSLSMAAAWTGFVHCLCGPDHYVPFVAMSRVGEWSLRKTLVITFLCGIGHVLGSAVLGFVGIALGLIVFQLEQTEAIRGDIAAWALFGFGLAYTVGGMIYALRRPPSVQEPMLSATVPVQDDPGTKEHSSSDRPGPSL
jgi:sulfite exporter TauE/SafE